MSEPPVRRRSGDPIAPVTAALIQESAVGPREGLRRRPSTTPWQERVKDYDLNGPGVAGYYLDTVALMASLCPLYVSVRNRSGGFDRSDDPILQVALDAFRGALQSQSDLVFDAVRGREALGRVWAIRDVETGYNITTETRSVDAFRVQWTDLFGRSRITSAEEVWRSFYPDPYRKWEPTSPMRRALPDLRRLRSFIRNQTRGADSRMVTNGIVSFAQDPVAAGSRPYDNLDDPGMGSGGRRGVRKAIDDFIDMSKLAHQDDESPASMVPFPHEGPAPVYTELGRLIDPAALQGEGNAIEGFARAVNFPQQLLAQGPGASNHWNEFLVQESAVKMALAPKLEPFCNDLLVFHLQPLIERFRNQLTTWRRSVDPRHVKIEFDLSFLLRRPSQVQEMFEAYRLGIATRQMVADELGITGEILTIPTGLSEYEHWELATMGKGAPYAEVDRENNLIVPDPMGGMPGLPPGDPGAPTADAGGAVADALGLPAAGQAGQAPSGGDGTITEPAMTAALAPLALPPVRAVARMSTAKALDVAQAVAEARAAREAESPPGDRGAAGDTASVTAALDDDPEVATTRRLLADAAAADVQMSATLAGLLAAITAAVQVEVAKQVIQAHPQRSMIRQRLAQLPVSQVWAEADPAVKAQVPVDRIVEDVVARYRPQIAAAYQEAGTGFLDRWGGVIAAVVVLGAVSAAVDALVSGFVGWATLRYRPTLVVEGRPRPRRVPTRAGVPAPDDTLGLGLTTSDGATATPPAAIIRDSLVVAGGAQPDRNDLPVRDGDGDPTPTAGGEWQGGHGWFTGHNVVAAAAGPGAKIRWRWRHAFIRRPKDPFDPHKDLDGKVFDRPSAVPGGYFVGDHPFCTCGMLPEV